MKRTPLVLFCLACIASCATNPFPLKAFEPGVHGSIAEEWAPHHNVIEWWYATEILEDEEENHYLVQFTIFHGRRFGAIEGFVLHLAVTDVGNRKHYFFEDACQPRAAIYGNGKEIVFKANRISPVMSDGSISTLIMEGRAPAFSYSLTARLSKPPVWHGEDGVIVMGHEGESGERSLYYSFTGMDTEGVLELAGTRHRVRGSGWFDRQWGEFTETAWDWFSLRLFDGSERMLFAFPGTGYTCGTLISPDGTASALPRFTYTRLAAMRYVMRGRTYSLGWSIRLASGEEYRIVPRLADQGNPARMTPKYWEGICDVLSPAGEKLGFCVVETTHGAQERGRIAPRPRHGAADALY